MEALIQWPERLEWCVAAASVPVTGAVSSALRMVTLKTQQYKLSIALVKLSDAQKLNVV